MAARSAVVKRVLHVGVAVTCTGLKEMLGKSFKEEQALRVDERLGRIVRIIVEEYDGNVEAFVESIRYKVEVNRMAEAASARGEEAAFQQV